MPDGMTATPEAVAAPPAAMPPPPQGATPPGPTGPATMAPNRQAMRMRGMVVANVGLDMLDKAIGLLGSTSEEGQAILKALNALGKIFGAQRSQQLSQAEMKLMGAQQGMGGGPQPMPAMAAKNRLASMGLGGAPPGGAPAPGGM